jgi:CDGSH-type Zn-finger protein
MAKEEAQTPPTISATPNGPYRVRGVRRIVWREPVSTEAGEPVAWRTGEVVADEDTEYWLCRCGNSRNKPFCDNSHRRVGFEAEDAAPAGARQERVTSYGGADFVLDDDRSICAHAGFCATKATNAWKLAARSDRDTADTSQLVAMGQRCPSGALTVRTDEDALEPALPVEIALIPDGPLWVTGGVRVERSDGQQLEVRNRTTLCRCGASKNKPLCDGSHSDVGFQSRPVRFGATGEVVSEPGAQSEEH